MEVNVKNVQLNVAFRRLVDLGEKVRCEQRSKQVAIKEARIKSIGLPAQVFEGHVTNTAQNHGQQYGQEIQAMRPSVSRAMEDIDEEMQQILNEVEDDEQNNIDHDSMDNIDAPKQINEGHHRANSRRSQSGHIGEDNS